MSIDLDTFCLDIPSTMLFATDLSVATGFGGCWWTISARVVRIEFAF